MLNIFLYYDNPSHHMQAGGMANKDSGPAFFEDMDNGAEAGDAYTFLEFNTQGSEFTDEAFPDFTELSQSQSQVDPGTHLSSTVSDAFDKSYHEQRRSFVFDGC